MLELDSVTKRFGDKTVLDGFSFRFVKEKTTCLTGPSGCGKTTLLKIAAGLLAPDAGKLICPDGQRLSFVFQEDRLLPWADALANLTVLGIERYKVADALQSVGLQGELHAMPGDLSGGMRRRVSIARAIAFDGELFFLDEPLQGLDAATAEPVLLALRQAVRGKTALLITHDAEEAFALGDVFIKLDGPPLRIVKTADAKEFESANALKEWLA